MNATRVFARARPRAITIQETYRYTGEVSRNTYIDLAHSEDAPETASQGTITVEVPYDGQQWFSAQARQDVETGRTCGRKSDEAVIGYLAFANIGHTDLAGRLQTNLASLAWPLILPLADGQSDLQMLLARDAVARLHQTYHISPDALDIVPLRVAVDITDEGPEPARDSKGSAMRYGFQPNLMLGFQLEVTLPEELAPREVALRRACLTWPYLTTSSLLRLQTQEGQDWNNMQPVWFDATSRQVLWSDENLPQGQALLRKEAQSSVAAGYVTFRAPCMRLWTERPTDLYQADRLQLSFEILLEDILLSGLRVKTFDATGQPARWPIEACSILQADLSIWLEDRFQEKTYTPRCFLVFEGVVASPERVDDIRALLHDMGFTITGEQPKVEAGGASRQFSLTAERTERSRQMQLRLALRGETAQTTVSTYVRGGRSYRTDQTTGRSTLEIVVSQAADHVLLTQTLSELQEKLKERFRHVRSIK